LGGWWSRPRRGKGRCRLGGVGRKGGRMGEGVGESRRGRFRVGGPAARAS